MDNQEKRKVVLVTGGTGDIGQAIIRKYHSIGAKVYFTYHSNFEAAKKISEELNNEVYPIQVNISDMEDVEKAIEYIEEKEENIDILVNNAGINHDKLFAFMNEEEWGSVIETNLNGIFHGCKCVIKKMIGQKSGNIINISSVSGMIGIEGQCNYSASKAGIIGFTKALSREVGRYGIRVNSVSPGFIESKMTDELNKKLLDDYVKKIPLRKIGKTEEVANVVAFLSSDDASYVTGSNIVIDGGMS